MKPKREGEEDRYDRWRKLNKPPDPKPREIKLKSYLVTFLDDEFKRNHTMIISQEYNVFTGKIKFACQMTDKDGHLWWSTEKQSKDLSIVKGFIREFLRSLGSM